MKTIFFIVAILNIIISMTIFTGHYVPNMVNCGIDKFLLGCAFALYGLEYK